MEQTQMLKVAIEDVTGVTLSQTNVLKTGKHTRDLVITTKEGTIIVSLSEDDRTDLQLTFGKRREPRASDWKKIVKDQVLG
jgi:hypothetical protein